MPPSLNAPSSIPRDHRVQVRTDFPMCVLGFPHVCTCAVLNPDTHANPCLDHHFYRELSKARMNTLAPGSFGDQQNSSSPDKGETIGSRRGDSGHRQTLACPFTAPMFLSAMGKLVASTNPHALPPAGYLPVARLCASIDHESYLLSWG